MYFFAVFLRENSLIIILRTRTWGFWTPANSPGGGPWCFHLLGGLGFFLRLRLWPDRAATRKQASCLACRSCLGISGISDGIAGRFFFGKDVGRMYRSYLILQMDIWYTNFSGCTVRSSIHMRTFTNTHTTTIANFSAIIQTEWTNFCFGKHHEVRSWNKFCGCMRSGDLGYHPFPGNLRNR